MIVQLVLQIMQIKNILIKIKFVYEIPEYHMILLIQYLTYKLKIIKLNMTLIIIIRFFKYKIKKIYIFLIN